MTQSAGAELTDMVYTMAEAAAVLKVSPRTVLNMVENGDIGAIVVGRSTSQKHLHKRITREELERYIREIGAYDPMK